MSYTKQFLSTVSAVALAVPLLAYAGGDDAEITPPSDKCKQITEQGLPVDDKLSGEEKTLCLEYQAALLDAEFDKRNMDLDALLSELEEPEVTDAPASEL